MPIIELTTVIRAPRGRVFESPLGILGKITDWLFLASYMRGFLVRRNEVLKHVAESAEWRRYLERGQSAALHSLLNRVEPDKTKNPIP